MLSPEETRGAGVYTPLDERSLDARETTKASRLFARQESIVRVLVPIGTRPEIVKLATPVHSLRRRGFDVRVVATGQDDEPSLAPMFFERFAVVPDETWAPPPDEPERLTRILELAFREVDLRRPDCVLVVGGEYTVPFFSLAARRYAVPVVHLEAGLRSFNEISPEEVNRRIATQAASLHFAPTQMTARLLQREGVDRGRIRVVGSPIIDALRLAGARRRPPASRTGVVVTARLSDADNVERLAMLVDLVLRLADEFGSVTFPVHARTRARLLDSGDWSKLQRTAVRMFPPLPFDGMIELMATSRVVVTDSGGFQEEAAWLGVPVVVLQRSSPQWEGVSAGISTLTGVDTDRAVEAVRRFASDEEQTRIADIDCPYGDGHAGQRMAEILSGRAAQELLTLSAPDYVGKPLEVLASGELLVG